MTRVEVLNEILSKLLQCDISVLNTENMQFVSEIATTILSSSEQSDEDISCMDVIVKISNLVYNNTDSDFLFLEDGVYDLLLELYKKYNPNFQVGSYEVHFEPLGEMKINKNELIRPINKMDDDFIENSLFLKDLEKRAEYDPRLYYKAPVYVDVPIKKRTVNTPHKYPKLVGTLDKCKFVLNQQAIDRGSFNDSNVKIFERDFIGKHVSEGILDPNRKFYMVAELKYDGISVEAEVSDEVMSARSRGDTGQDIATDLTPILKGYKFHQAVGNVDHNEIFGMKFEAIITNDNLYQMSNMREREYANGRNGIIGLFGSSDANRFRDNITLVPLATSLEVDRLTEIEFLNKYYTSGVNLVYSVLYGNYQEILFQVKHFVEEAEYMRSFIPYMYDGIVLSYIEPDLIDILGRENSINKYSMAIKFNALKKYTKFLGYTYTVGQNGIVTPMINFIPVEFYGTIHNSETGHSYKRFKELNLRKDDIICVEYVHDVMCYITKPDVEENRTNENPVEEFPTVCPFCGTELVISDSGKSAVCPNKMCSERNLTRLDNMMSKLNIKDFSLQSLKAIYDAYPDRDMSLVSLVTLKPEEISFLGPNDSVAFVQAIANVVFQPIYDYRLIGSLGFSNIAIEKWKIIMRHMKLSSLIMDPDDYIIQILKPVKGIGPATIDIIIEERPFFMNDIIFIASLPNLISTFGVENKGMKIRFTGFRNKDLVDQLNSLGHDAGEGAITKDTDYLLVPIEGHISSKTNTAVKYGIPIIPVQDFIADMAEYLS